MRTEHAKPKGFAVLNRLVATALVAAGLSVTGCTSLLSPIQTIPANRVPREFLAEPQADKVPIDVSRLRIDKPDFYILDSEDVLGVFVDGVLGQFDAPPPVQLPTPNSDLPPAIGFPVPIREDGTIALPFVEPIPVRGLTIPQAEELIKRTYFDGPNPILRGSASRVIVTLIRERTYRVFVIRADLNQAGALGQTGRQGRGVAARDDQSSRPFVLQLPAYQNDVLNALSLTGGFPGVNAKPEIRVLRGDRVTAAERDAQIREFYRTNKAEDFPFGIIPTVPDDSATLKIPLRLRPGQVPNFRKEDVELRDGDIVYVDNRDTELYYTGGLLGGGEFLLPRDYDLDILGAVSLSGANILIGQPVGAFGVNASGVAPSNLVVLRRIPGNRQIAIRVDLTEAINDPASRILVKTGDTLILRFKPQEELVNFGLSTFFLFGIRQLNR
jgi:protein involved in polysaccharide export with SLBB domain